LKIAQTVVCLQVRTKNKEEKVIEVTWSPSGSHLCTQSIRELVGGGGGAQVAAHNTEATAAADSNARNLTAFFRSVFMVFFSRQIRA